jgi:hypothetical protein
VIIDAEFIDESITRAFSHMDDDEGERASLWDSRKGYVELDEFNPFRSENTFPREHDLFKFGPTAITCFNLSSSRYMDVAMKDLTKISWNHSAMNELVLEKEKKDLLRHAAMSQLIQELERNATAVNFKDDKSRQKDIIEGKGEVRPSRKFSG